MFAEILTIGDELCRGEIVNTNSSWFAEQLWELDVAPAWMTSCRDIATDIRAAIETAAQRAQLIIVSGGLGATEDDLTVDVLASMMGVSAAVDTEAKDRWVRRFKVLNRPLNSKTERQLRVPRGARVHRNEVGAAPGFEVLFRGVPVICMPGVPREVHSIWTTGVGARIRQLRDGQGGGRIHLAQKTFRVFGRGESMLSVALDGLFDTPIEFISDNKDERPPSFEESIHYRVKFPEVLIKLIVRGVNKDAAAARLEQLGNELCRRLGWLVFGVNDETLGAVVGRELAAAGHTVAVAESCTAGGLGAELTETPGSSAYFAGGVIAYSNDLKKRLLGVLDSTLLENGAVSEQCASEMARGVVECTGADIGVAVTGIAGPGGGSADKPVGTVWLAVARGGCVETLHMEWPGSRQRVRKMAVFKALALLRKVLSPAVGLTHNLDL